VDALGCRTFCSELINTFVFDMLQICTGCFRFDVSALRSALLHPRGCGSGGWKMWHTWDRSHKDFRSESLKKKLLAKSRCR
jgi:hypothetical protein